MAYSIDFPDAARRHHAAAESLYEHEPAKRRRDIAGYLYGIAAECALKQILRRSLAWHEPEYLHFPELKSAVRERAQGRYASALRRFSETAFMNGWDIKMRYAPRREVSDGLVERWREQAKEIIAAMDDC